MEDPPLNVPVEEDGLLVEVVPVETLLEEPPLNVLVEEEDGLLVEVDVDVDVGVFDDEPPLNVLVVLFVVGVLTDLVGVDDLEIDEEVEKDPLLEDVLGELLLLEPPLKAANALACITSIRTRTSTEIFFAKVIIPHFWFLTSSR